VASLKIYLQTNAQNLIQGNRILQTLIFGTVNIVSNARMSLFVLRKYSVRITGGVLLYYITLATKIDLLIQQFFCFRHNIVNC